MHKFRKHLKTDSNLFKEDFILYFVYLLFVRIPNLCPKIIANPSLPRPVPVVTFSHLDPFSLRVFECEGRGQCHLYATSYALVLTVSLSGR